MVVNGLDSYIKNKRKQEKVVSILSIVFWILNFIFVELSVNMLLKIVTAGNSDWFAEAAKREVTNDPFIMNRSEMIINTILVVLLVIVSFSVVTIVLIRKMQLKNMLTQMAIYIISGYDKRKVFEICMLEPISDMLVAFPVSVVFSIGIWSGISKTEMIATLLKIMNNSVWLDLSAYVMCAGFMILVTAVHTLFFIKISVKKGIRYMLGKGVV